MREETLQRPAWDISAVRKRFTSNERRLFLVDECKSRAVKTAAALIDERMSTVILCTDSVTAEELKGAFEKSKYVLIDSMEKLREMFGQINGEIQKAPELASAFRERFSKIIVTDKDAETGEPFLHAKLLSNKSRDGIFNSAKEKAPYCVSDFIAHCGYEFAVVENVYAFLHFVSEDRTETKNPTQCDRINFLGENYYTELAHSYRRLKRICGAADACLLLSDVMVNRNAVNLYAALSLLFEHLPYRAAKEFLTEIVPASDYNEECERVCSEIYYCKDDNEIISNCLQITRNAVQRAPSDSDSMKQYLSEAFDSMSQEEIFLKVIYGYATLKYDRENRKFQDIFDELDGDSYEMARCFCSVFFEDKIKGQLEGRISNAHICRMNKQEISALTEVFLRYGFYCDSDTTNRCHMFRICRDDSGFEYSVRAERQKSVGMGYSCFGNESEIAYKAVALARLYDGREKRIAPIQSPTLVVVSEITDEILTTICKVLPDFSVSATVSDLSEVGEKRIVVTDAVQFKRTVLDLKIKSAVFFDAPDVAVYPTLVKKALGYGDVRVVLFASYSNLSGLLFDDWQEAFEAFDYASAPIGISEIILKDGTYDIYSHLINRMDLTYRLLQRALYGEDCTDEFIKRFNMLITKYTLQMSVSKDEAESDFNYLVESAEMFNGVYKNSLSVGGKGEQVQAVTHTFSRDGKGKAISERTETVQGQAIVFFDTCAKLFRRDCNILEKDCCDCTEYHRLLTNRFREFERCVKEFLDFSLEFTEISEEKRLKNNGTIWSGDTENGSWKFLRGQIEELIKRMSGALTAIRKRGQQTDGMFYVNYSDIAEIHEALYLIYAKFFNKYFKKLKDIFDMASEKMKNVFETVNSGFNAQARS